MDGDDPLAIVYVVAIIMAGLVAMVWLSQARDLELEQQQVSDRLSRFDAMLERRQLDARLHALEVLHPTGRLGECDALEEARWRHR